MWVLTVHWWKCCTVVVPWLLCVVSCCNSSLIEVYCCCSVVVVCCNSSLIEVLYSYCSVVVVCSNSSLNTGKYVCRIYHVNHGTKQPEVLFSQECVVVVEPCPFQQNHSQKDSSQMKNLRMFLAYQFDSLIIDPNVYIILINCFSD